MPQHDYDLFVIGAGSGGVRAARMSAGHGARVAIAEESRVGGTCVIRGCIPKKLLVYAAHVREEIEDHIYGVHRLPSSNAVDSAICILRSKLGPSGRVLIRTLRGQGYALEEVAR